MTLPPVSSTSSAAAGGPERPARSPEEAARQFEAVLVRQFVEVMTKNLFDGEAEGMMTGQADLQRDTLTDVLTGHLVESGAFGIADLMERQWAAQQTAPEPARPASGDAPPAGAPGRPLSMDEALRMFAPAQGRPVSIDTSLDEASRTRRSAPR